MTDERITRGAGWLDTQRPGWVDEIDIEKLDQRDGYACIIGQLYGNGSGWTVGLRNSGLVGSAREYGFTHPNTAVMAADTKEWVKLITERRERTRRRSPEWRNEHLEKLRKLGPELDKRNRKFAKAEEKVQAAMQARQDAMKARDELLAEYDAAMKELQA